MPPSFAGRRWNAFAAPQPNPAPAEYEDHVANVLCPLLAEHDVLLDLHSFRTPGEPFVMRGPADNDGPLEPFRQAAAEARALIGHPVETRDGTAAGEIRDFTLTGADGGIDRVVIGSGGLSHFYLDEELDHRVLEACRNKDAESLSTIPPRSSCGFPTNRN